MKRMCKLLPVIGLTSLLGACAFGESMTVYEAMEPTAAQRAMVLEESEQESLLTPDQRSDAESQLLAISEENERKAQETVRSASDIEELKALAAQAEQGAQ